MPHAGKSYSNDRYIGFEMCEPAQLKYTTGAKFTVSDLTAARNYVNKTYKNAVELFATLCKFHNKNPLEKGVIYSHNELGKAGIGSTHVDPEHLWTGLGLPYTMDGFRKDVYNKMNNLPISNEEEEEEMTQAQFNEFMANYLKDLETKAPGSWSKKDREWAIKNGLIQGGTPLPNGEPNYMWQSTMTREQMVAVLHRFAKLDD